MLWSLKTSSKNFNPFSLISAKKTRNPHFICRYVVYQCVNRLIQILTNKSELPIMKFNALMATRYFFDTCEYAAVIFI